MAERNDRRGPAGFRPEITARLPACWRQCTRRRRQVNAAITGLQSPETKATFAKFSAEAKIGSPQEFADFIATQVPIWGALVKAAALKIE